jgi:hypothetical protein
VPVPVPVPVPVVVPVEPGDVLFPFTSVPVPLVLLPRFGSVLLFALPVVVGLVVFVVRFPVPLMLPSSVFLVAFIDFEVDFEVLPFLSVLFVFLLDVEVESVCAEAATVKNNIAANEKISFFMIVLFLK